ncbi:hypothetical protein [Paenibacillus sp. NPDC057934]|uniref:hypothetical protein n=1 Tax=Paenibacillus sp. NPDC057934 TaxID=3346282 RepID=UPI0036DF8107
MKFEEAKKLLKEDGVFVDANPQLVGHSELTATENNPYLFVAHGTGEHLQEILKYVAREQVISVVEAVYPIQD